MIRHTFKVLQQILQYSNKVCLPTLKYFVIKGCPLQKNQKQLSRGVLKKRCSENMQQIYRRTPMTKCDFNKVAILLKSHFDGCSSVNLLHIFRTPSPKNTSWWLLLKTEVFFERFLQQICHYLNFA